MLPHTASAPLAVESEPSGTCVPYATERDPGLGEHSARRVRAAEAGFAFGFPIRGQWSRAEDLLWGRCKAEG